MSITARFAIRRGDFVCDVDLVLPARGVTGLFGPSGCGKTSLLRAFAGLDRYPGAHLEVGDEVWQAGSRFLPPHRRQLGYVFQEASLFAHLNVRGNVEYGLRRLPSAARRASFDQAVALLGIDPLLARRPETLSGGERQRVALARALAAGPGLLLLDEPLAALDRDGRREILPYLESLRDELELPIIHVSHDPVEMARLADHLVLMSAGKVEAAGPVAETLARLDLAPARGRDAATVVDATVAGHDPEHHLTHLDFAGGRFIVTQRDLPVGGRVRLRLAARDVSLTRERQSGTSILNILAATVTGIVPAGPGQVTVRLDTGGVPLLSRITRRSAEALELRAGRSVYAQIKSVVLLG